MQYQPSHVPTPHLHVVLLLPNVPRPHSGLLSGEARLVQLSNLIPGLQHLRGQCGHTHLQTELPGRCISYVNHRGDVLVDFAQRGGDQTLSAHD